MTMHATSPSFQTITFIAVLKATRHLFARGAAHVTIYATHIVNLFFFFSSSISLSLKICTDRSKFQKKNLIYWYFNFNSCFLFLIIISAILSNFNLFSILLLNSWLWFVSFSKYDPHYFDFDFFMLGLVVNLIFPFNFSLRFKILCCPLIYYHSKFGFHSFNCYFVFWIAWYD